MSRTNASCREWDITENVFTWGTSVFPASRRYCYSCHCVVKVIWGPARYIGYQWDYEIVCIQCGSMDTECISERLASELPRGNNASYTIP